MLKQEPLFIQVKIITAMKEPDHTSVSTVFSGFSVRSTLTIVFFLLVTCPSGKGSGPAISSHPARHSQGFEPATYPSGPAQPSRSIEPALCPSGESIGPAVYPTHQTQNSQGSEPATYSSHPPHPAPSPSQAGRSIEIKRSADFEICGQGTAAPWETTAWVEIPRRTQGRVDYSTRVRILYSETGIYFLFHCEDRVITATMKADNLDLWKEDVVEVFLMPDEKYPLYFEYQLSPLNYELTLLIPNLEGNFLGWLPWKYEGDRQTRRRATILTDSQGSVTGWNAEFFIPWKLMEPLITGPPLPGDTWKANMYRLDYDNGATRFSWQETERNFHEPHNFGTFIFK
jgi:hypothetical protein